MRKSFSDVCRAQRGLEEFVGSIDDDACVSITEDEDGFGFLVLVPTRASRERIPVTFDDIRVTVEVVSEPLALSR